MIELIKCWYDLVHQIITATGIPQRLLKVDPYHSVAYTDPISSDWDQNRAVTPQDQGRVQEKTKKPISEETRTKMRQAKMGENNPMYGKKHSKATKAKMKAKQHEALRNRPIPY